MTYNVDSTRNSRTASKAARRKYGLPLSHLDQAPSLQPVRRPRRCLGPLQVCISPSRVDPLEAQQVEHLLLRLRVELLRVVPPGAASASVPDQRTSRQQDTHIPELSNFIPSLSFAHCLRSRWNMIEPVLRIAPRAAIDIDASASEEHKHSPSEDGRPIDLWGRKDEVESPARAVVEWRRGRKGEHGECLLQAIPMLLSEGVVGMEATEIWPQSERGDPPVTMARRTHNVCHHACRGIESQRTR